MLKIAEKCSLPPILAENSAISPTRTGYTPSFTSSQRNELRAFFERYGVVVIRDVLTAEQVAATAAEVFKTAGLSSPPPLTFEELEKIDWERYVVPFQMARGLLRLQVLSLFFILPLTANPLRLVVFAAPQRIREPVQSQQRLRWFRTVGTHAIYRSL